MLVEENSNKKPLPPLINLKYGEKTKKIYRLAKLKSEDFTYSNIIALIKNYKQIKNNINICILLKKPEVKDTIVIKSEKDFNNFLNSEALFTFLDKSNIKMEFFYTLPSPEGIKDKANSSQLEKVFQELSTDNNSKLVLDFIIDYLAKQRDFPEKLFDNLKENNVMNNSGNIFSKEDFSKDIIPGLMKNIKENYETLINTRDTNLNLNVSFNKAINTSIEETENNNEFRTFSEVYNPEEIEDFSSRIVRDTLSSIQIIK